MWLDNDWIFGGLRGAWLVLNIEPAISVDLKKLHCTKLGVPIANCAKQSIIDVNND